MHASIWPADHEHAHLWRLVCHSALIISCMLVTDPQIQRFRSMGVPGTSQRHVGSKGALPRKQGAHMALTARYVHPRVSAPVPAIYSASSALPGCVREVVLDGVRRCPSSCSMQNTQVPPTVTQPACNLFGCLLLVAPTIARVGCVWALQVVLSTATTVCRSCQGPGAATATAAAVAGGAAVETCVVAGLDHCWIGGRSGGFPTCVPRPGDVDATDRMLDFFARYTTVNATSQ